MNEESLRLWLVELDNNTLRTVAWAHGVHVANFCESRVKPNGKISLIPLPMDEDEREELVCMVIAKRGGH